MELLAGERLIWAGHPTWRATISTIVRGLVVAAALFAVGVLVDKLGGGAKWVGYGALAFVVVAGGTILYSWVTRQFTEYTITDQRLNVRWGVLSKQETTTTVDRIQNLTITQTLVDRVLNTGTIDFDTASDTSDARFRFHGINRPGELRQRVNELRVGGPTSRDTSGGL